MNYTALDKILTISAKDYAEANGCLIKNYQMKGIQIYIEFNKLKNESEFKKKLAEQIPDDCEAIVDFKISSFSAHSGMETRHETFIGVGTALMKK